MPKCLVLAAVQFHLFLDWEFADWLLVPCEKQILFGAQCKDSWLWLFEMFAFFFVFVAAAQIVVASEPELPRVSPEMTQHEFEPSVARLFLVVNVGVIQHVSSLDLGPLFAEAAFEKMLPSCFVL